MGNGDDKKKDENGLRPVTKAEQPFSKRDSGYGRPKPKDDVFVPCKKDITPPPETDSGNGDD